VNTLAGNLRRGDRRERARRGPDGAGGDAGENCEGAVDPAPAVDHALADQEDAATRRRRGLKLLAHLEVRDPVAAKVLRAICEGVEGTAALAACAGCTPEEVRLAWGRMKYHADRILEAEEREQRRGV
jgi:hypothetical protein